MKKYIVEFIGTFFLVLSVIMANNNPSVALLAPLAVAAMLIAMIYAGGHISGAHYNPAVTLAMFMRRRIDRVDAVYYVLAQLLAALTAAALGTFLHQNEGGPAIALHTNGAPFGSLLAEVLGTFALAYTILQVATTRANAGRSHYGLAIGLVVLGAGCVFGELSGAIFNPALAVGASVAGMFSWGDFWIYFLGSLAGAAAAASVFRVVYGWEE
jgi:aquaporin Z